ncbi:SDR family NAD(P)-dependent oxidoreductase [Lactobacillus ultunensis]|uniref:Oxidoreductase, short chain dehydrogenase/reductase family protein n=1 Tax=Lactobacillus ultunensis DSM 16047 TaxID=525365 RepID=C2EK71_9LACO|nr:SDR family oxidoreductase [Lactobacillus ultunensis]EEJ73086.1 oxidoreductase, short chain dehydrogenase/reductase family protein [Lactobacillus ultunensis DSM 16047]KRL82645.1 carbonyl reductase (NADPH) [Lactobacillus ultunensis DSM 16047]QQP29396.1 SDR family oxidoreductase [Lactobacillus ultunensis]
MDLGLTGKKALITGSTKGIGKAIAIEMAREGANVIINGRNEKTVNSVVKEIKSAFPTTSPLGAAFDISSEDGQQSLFEQIPEVDILVNNMGIFQPMNYFDITEEVWQHFIDVNFYSGNALSKFYLPKMLKHDFGRIIFIASEEAVMPSGEMPQYSLTKTMNLSLAKSLSKLTKATHVTVNTIMPGSTLTEGVEQMLEDMYKDSDLPRDQWESDFMKNHRPLSQIQRLIRPEEVGRFTAFVASPYSSSFSGEALRLDGGLVPTLY